MPQAVAMATAAARWTSSPSKASVLEALGNSPGAFTFSGSYWRGFDTCCVDRQAGVTRKCPWRA